MSVRFLSKFIAAKFILLFLIAGNPVQASPYRFCPDSTCDSLEFFVSALYWRATQTVEWATTLTPFPNPSRVAYRTITFDWDPGFRVGAAYKLANACWDTQLAYTQFCTQTSDAAAGNVVSAFLGTTVLQIGPYEAGKIHWNLDFFTIDWDMGRTFCATPWLAFRPYLGVKGGGIFQALKTEWENLSVLLIATEKLKNNFWGVGPKGGINGKWTLCCSRNGLFSLFGDFGAAFMWGNWNIVDHFLDDFGTFVNVEAGKRRFGSFVIQSLLGVSLACPVNKQRAHVTLKLGYEIQDWFNQYQVFDDFTGTHNNDLILRGVTFSLIVDF